MAIRRDSRGLAKGRKGGSPLVFRFDTPAAVSVSIAPDGQSNRENIGKGAIWWEPAEQHKRGSPNTSSSLECHYCVCVHRWTLAVFLLWGFFNGLYTPPLDVPIHNHKREAVSLSLPVRAALILYNSPMEEEEEEKKDRHVKGMCFGIAKEEDSDWTVNSDISVDLCEFNFIFTRMF